MDELQEKVERMNALSSGGVRRSNSGNWRRSSRRSRTGSGRRSSSLGSSERSGSSSSSSGGSGSSSQRSRSSGRRSVKKGTKQEYAKRISASTEAPRSTPRDDPPSLPSRKRRADSPEKTKEPLKWTSQKGGNRSPARRRSPSNAAGSANGSFQVTQRKNIALSSFGSGSNSRGRRRSRAAQRAAASLSPLGQTRENGNPELEDPLEDMSIPGAFSVHSSGQVSLLSSPSSHHNRSAWISLDGSTRSSISTLSTPSTHRRLLDISNRSAGSSARGRRSSRGNRRSLDISIRSSCSSVHSRSSLQSWPEEHEEEEEDEEIDDDFTLGENTLTSRSRSTVLGSVDEATEPVTASSEPVIPASVTRDIEEELEEARAQGRQEALNEVSGSNSSEEMLVVVATSDDENSQGSDVVDERKKRKVLCWAFLLCSLLLVVGVGATALLFGGKSEGAKQMEPVKNQDDLEADLESTFQGIIIYIPPTQAECDAIATGVITEDQKSFIQKSFGIQIDITLAGESAFGSLVTDLVRHIQQELVPSLAGCQAINFFDATIAITGGLTGITNTTAAIANGQVQESRQSACEADPIGNCISYELILDLYLEEDKPNAMLLEAIGEIVTSEDIATTLGALYPVQAASVPSIEVLADDGATSPPAPTQDPVRG